jgi:translation initiation factor IF-1
MEYYLLRCVLSLIMINPSEEQEPKNKSSKNTIKKEGRVIEALPNAFFKVLIDDNKEILGFLSGKMKLNRIKILPGDKVTIEMSPYDNTKGRIVYRLK